MLVVPLARWPALRSASRTGRDGEEPVCEHVPRQEAATRTVRRRWSVSLVPTGSCLLWGMALLSLLLLPADYRAGSEAPHGHSLIQLWADASDGRVDHHVAHEHIASDPVPAASWFDPAVGETNDVRPIGLEDERPEVATQHESAPVSLSLDLLVTATTAITILRLHQVSRAHSDRKRTGLPARILVPPPRWTATTS